MVRSLTDYSVLDRPEVLARLFHPTREWAERGGSSGVRDLMIPVEPDVVVGARFHLAGSETIGFRGRS
jgi:hypothetical protein